MDKVPWYKCYVLLYLPFVSFICIIHDDDDDPMVSIVPTIRNINNVSRMCACTYVSLCGGVRDSDLFSPPAVSGAAREARKGGDAGG